MLTPDEAKGVPRPQREQKPKEDETNWEQERDAMIERVNKFLRDGNYRGRPFQLEIGKGCQKARKGFVQHLEAHGWRADEKMFFDRGTENWVARIKQAF